MRTILIALAVLSIQSTSFAQTSNDDAAIQGALDARNNIVTALENKDFTGITHDAMDAAINELAQNIRDEHNDNASADALLNDWNKTSNDFAGFIAARLMMRDLGDHSPLFPWLEADIQKLANKYGTILLSLPIVKDIQMLNYAIPVVFSPHGAWQSNDVDNRIEYRKHFIPFANIVTYYVTEVGCKYALAHAGSSDMKKICPKAAAKLEHVMGRYIAPVVSDWIYRAANRPLNINNNQLKYNSVDDLRKAIQ